MSRLHKLRLAWRERRINLRIRDCAALIEKTTIERVLLKNERQKAADTLTQLLLEREDVRRLRNG